MIAHGEDPATVDTHRRGRHGRWPWILGALAVAVLLCGLATPIVYWDGSVNRPISVVVLDSEEERAIAGATVALEIPSDRSLAEDLSPQEMADFLSHNKRLATCNDWGQALLRGQFGAGGSQSFFGRSGKFGVEGYLKVSHPDYRTSEELLQNYLGERRFAIGTKQLNIRIYLVRRSSADPALQPAAGPSNAK